MVVVMVTAAVRVVVVISTNLFNCIFFGGIRCIPASTPALPHTIHLTMALLMMVK